MSIWYKYRYLYFRRQARTKENAMNPMRTRLAQRTRRLAHAPLEELQALFGPFVPLEEALSAPGRRRLFFPRAPVLAVFGPGPVRAEVVPRHRVRVCGRPGRAGR